MREESRLFDSEESSEIMLLNRKLTDMQMMFEAAQEDAEAQKQLVSELGKYQTFFVRYSGKPLKFKLLDSIENLFLSKKCTNIFNLSAGCYTS